MHEPRCSLDVEYSRRVITFMFTFLQDDKRPRISCTSDFDTLSKHFIQAQNRKKLLRVKFSSVFIVDGHGIFDLILDVVHVISRFPFLFRISFFASRGSSGLARVNDL